MQIEDKLKALHQLQAQKTVLENEIKYLNANIEQAQAEIVDEFESRQIKSMKIDGVGMFFLRVSSYPKVYDPALLRNWMDNKGISWEVVAALNAKKLQGFYNERLESGEELPQGVEPFTKMQVIMKAS